MFSIIPTVNFFFFSCHINSVICKCFQIGLILSFGKELTLYHTIPTFDNPKEGGFGKHCGKRRKCWFPAFSPFPTVFSTLSKGEIRITATFNLPSTTALNLVLSKNLLFGRKLKDQINSFFLTDDDTRSLVNSVDQDQTAQNVQSDL